MSRPEFFRAFKRLVGPKTLIVTHGAVSNFTALQIIPTNIVVDTSIQFDHPAVPRFGPPLWHLEQYYGVEQPESCTKTAKNLNTLSALLGLICDNGESVPGGQTDLADLRPDGKGRTVDV